MSIIGGFPRVFTVGRLHRMATGHRHHQSVLEKKIHTSSPTRKRKREFDFSMYHKRHIALRVAYMGWDYHGFAIQEPPHVTVEKRLFDCLKLTKLIEDQQTCNYARCGRTDKGVSALGQVISLQVRSNLLDGEGLIVADGNRVDTRQGDTSTELPYMVMLNRNLPDDIRVLSWAPVDPEFSARFSCKQRTYKYFFPRGNLDIDLMNQAAQLYLGEHDFRNFCKMDINGGVTNFNRTIVSFKVNSLDNSPPSSYQMCEMTIVGKAFLMHQVRCMAAILFLIGSRLEQPDIITHMLNIDRCPRKPQYGMASPEPLVLYDCEFEGVAWQRDERAYESVVKHFQGMWTTQMTRVAMVRSMLKTLEGSLLDSHPVPSSQLLPLMTSELKGTYKPLLDRPSAGSFEERYEQHQAKRRRLADTNTADDANPTATSEQTTHPS